MRAQLIVDPMRGVQLGSKRVYIPWSWKAFRQAAPRRSRCCCRHCCTALSPSANCFRHRRDASREQASRSKGVPFSPSARALRDPSTNAQMPIKTILFIRSSRMLVRFPGIWSAISVPPPDRRLLDSTGFIKLRIVSACRTIPQRKIRRLPSPATAANARQLTGVPATASRAAADVASGRRDREAHRCLAPCLEMPWKCHGVSGNVSCAD